MARRDASTCHGSNAWHQNTNKTHKTHRRQKQPTVRIDAATDHRMVGGNTNDSISVTINDLIKAGLYDPESVDAPDQLAALQLLLKQDATIKKLRTEADDFNMLATQLTLLSSNKQLTRTKLTSHTNVAIEKIQQL